MYHSTGSMTDVPHSVAVETEKKSIFKNNNIGDGDLLSLTLFHPLGCRSRERERESEFRFTFWTEVYQYMSSCNG